LSALARRVERREHDECANMNRRGERFGRVERREHA
jgi:hypothetical protein